jgi:hypothetical protein
LSLLINSIQISFLFQDTTFLEKLGLKARPETPSGKKFPQQSFRIQFEQRTIESGPDFTHLQLRCEGILVDTRYHVAEGESTEEAEQYSLQEEEHTSRPVGIDTLQQPQYSGKKQKGLRLSFMIMTSSVQEDSGGLNDFLISRS